MINQPYNFTFIGRSGCGKGAQSELLKKLLEGKNGPGSALYIYTGARLRELAGHSEFFTARLLNEKSLKSGELTPNSLAIWAYTTEFIHGVTENNHIIVDGSPRAALEAQTLEKMFDFYGRENVFHVWLNVSEACLAHIQPNMKNVFSAIKIKHFFQRLRFQRRARRTVYNNVVVFRHSVNKFGRVGPNS